MPAPLDGVTLTDRTVATNGIHLHVVEAGPSSGPLVVLLHGFPEFWYGWRHQIPALAQAGFRVWVPDQRGYNLSDKPRGVSSYGLDLLARDILGLLDAAGAARAKVVGHDWGAAVGWWLAARYPERLERYVAINVPHHAVMAKALRGSWAQIKKSWYIFYFGIPWLPESNLRANSFDMMVRSLKHTSRRGTFSDEDISRYREAWGRPGAVTGMLNWYRAAIRQNLLRPPKPQQIEVPTLLIWGAQDRFLGQEMAQPSIDLCREGRLEVIQEATHWVMAEEPEQVNRLLLEELAKTR